MKLVTLSALALSAAFFAGSANAQQAPVDNVKGGAEGVVRTNPIGKLAQVIHEESEERVLIYEAKGLSSEKARAVAQRLS